MSDDFDKTDAKPEAMNMKHASKSPLDVFPFDPGIDDATVHDDKHDEAEKLTSEILSLAQIQSISARGRQCRSMPPECSISGLQICCSSLAASHNSSRTMSCVGVDSHCNCHSETYSTIITII